MADIKKIDGEKKSPELTYEQLKAYAQQTTEQAKRIFAENQKLREALVNTNFENTIKGLEINLRCLDHAEKFSPEFIKMIIGRIEDTLNPPKETKEEDTDNKEE